MAACGCGKEGRHGRGGGSSLTFGDPCLLQRVPEGNDGRIAVGRQPGAPGVTEEEEAQVTVLVCRFGGSTSPAGSHHVDGAPDPGPQGIPQRVSKLAIVLVRHAGGRPVALGLDFSLHRGFDPLKRAAQVVDAQPGGCQLRVLQHKHIHQARLLMPHACSLRDPDQGGHLRCCHLRAGTQVKRAVVVVHQDAVLGGAEDGHLAGAAQLALAAEEGVHTQGRWAAALLHPHSRRRSCVAVTATPAVIVIVHVWPAEQAAEQAAEGQAA